MTSSKIVSIFIAVVLVPYSYLVYSTVIVPEPSPFTTTERSFQGDDARKVVVVFRNDDLTVYSEPAHEDSVLSVFWKHGVKQTFGFIPDPNLYVSGDADTFAISGVMVDMLKLWNAEGKIDLAIHGYSHLRSEGSDGEFDKLPYDVQLSMIQRAKAMSDSILGTKVRIFAPPFNQADSNTIKACGAAGVNVFSGYLGGKPVMGVDQVNTNAALFTRGTPIPELRSQGLPGFEDVLRFAREGSGTALVVAFYHSRVDFEDPDIYAYLDSLLTDLSVDPDVEFASLGEVVERYGDLLPWYNLAGWNISEALVAESRSRPYMKLVRSVRELLGGSLLVDELYDRAVRSFWSGEYVQASRLAGEIVQRSDQYLTFGRLASIVAGAAVALLFFWVMKVRKRKNASLHLFGFGATVILVALVSAVVVNLGLNLSAQRITEINILAGLSVGMILLGTLLLQRFVWRRTTGTSASEDPKK